MKLLNFHAITPQGDGNPATWPWAWLALWAGPFHAITPQGDGNFKSLRQGKEEVAFHAITPQGDGNWSDLILGTIR